FVLVAIIVTVLVIRALPQTRSLGLATAYGLVVGGAIGNGADRIFRDGAVVDMLDLDFAPLQNFPVFNVADIGITVGAMLVAVLMVLEDRRLAREEPAVLEPLAGGGGAVQPDADDVQSETETDAPTDDAERPVQVPPGTDA
ncbi:MAG: signal peptidase II, partial [Actinomycetota bacterium]